MARRIFLGIPLTEEVTARVAPLIDALQRTEADCTFVSLENLHAQKRGRFWHPENPFSGFS